MFIYSVHSAWSHKATDISIDKKKNNNVCNLS